MKRRTFMGIIIVCLLVTLAPCADAENGLILGLGYPYASLKYDFNALAVEGRFVRGSGVQAYTGRGYWNFHESGKLKGFAGLEGGYIKFDTLDTKGTGSEGGAFVGGEYFMGEKLSLIMDFAPTLISLNSGNTDVSGVEYVVNLGVYYHFGESQSNADTPKVSNAENVSTAGKEPADPKIKAWLQQLKSSDWEERRKASFELGKAKAAEAAGPLLGLLDDENEKVCGAAALALGRIGDRRALKPLIEKLEDGPNSVRASAAKALGDLGDKRAVKALKAALKDDSEKVRQAAGAALDKLEE